jgi:hypothetical protein
VVRQAENRTLSRQLQNLRDSIVGGEQEKREHVMHAQMLSWQAQHRELKEKSRVRTLSAPSSSSVRFVVCLRAVLFVVTIV